MNKHIELLLNRKSEREYEQKEIEPEKINAIFDVINSSPTSSNSHDFSVIVIEDKKIKERISLNIPSQKHIVDAPLFLLFCADLNRIDYLFEKDNMNSETNTLNNLISSTGDAFIAASFAHSAALNLGLGSCFVGIVRASLDFLKDELNLNGKIIPLVGLTIGYTKLSNDIKPKINKIYKKYCMNTIKKEVNEYDDVMCKYYLNRSQNNKNTKWSESMKKIYEKRTNEIDDFISSNWKIK